MNGLTAFLVTKTFKLKDIDVLSVSFFVYFDDDFLKVENEGASRKRKNWMTLYLSINETKRDKYLIDTLRIG